MNAASVTESKSAIRRMLIPSMIGVLDRRSDRVEVIIIVIKVEIIIYS